MRAGPNEGISPVSVSPLEEDDDLEEVGGEVILESGEKAEHVGERIVAEDDVGDVRRLVDPKMPSRDEVEAHYLRAHIPYRNWCPVCVRARGKALDHKSGGDQERKLPEYRFDYCFLGDELGFKWTVLVGREQGNKA